MEEGLAAGHQVYQAVEPTLAARNLQNGLGDKAKAA
jgi:hypothetical protein